MSKKVSRRTIDRMQKDANKLLGNVIYAASKLDSEQNGYNDSIAISKAIEAIDIILISFNELEYSENINRKELMLWRSELECAGKDDAYTAAIAQALINMCKDILEACKELGILLEYKHELR